MDNLDVVREIYVLHSSPPVQINLSPLSVLQSRSQLSCIRPHLDVSLSTTLMPYNPQEQSGLVIQKHVYLETTFVTELLTSLL